jgi:hypothetical protein
MVDYDRCAFPAPLSMMDDSAAAAVDALNDEGERGEGLRTLADRRATEPLVTFSHFLPRPELLLEKRFLTLPCLPKAAGSAFLRARVAALCPDVHVSSESRPRNLLLPHLLPADQEFASLQAGIRPHALRMGHDAP